jgi:peptidoglycan/LPS O-acetylase OafA/YrhL
VVGFHAFPLWIRGGFVGVDVFFVISGFLISTIICDGLRTGSFSFQEFYGRRIKRIFPALVLILSASYAFGWFVLFAREYEQLGKYIAAAAGFVSNIILWNDSGYFDNAAETKPLLHLWSLGIEEQFYIVWPLLLWLAWRIRFNLLILTLAVASVSFALNISGIFHDDVSAFYSPQTRFWELLIGSLLACGHVRETPARSLPTGEGPNNKLHHIQSWLGACLIAVALLFLTKAQPFPGWWALLPTVGAVAIIAAGQRSGFNKLLAHPLLVWFGLISYPLYLWHWPLLAFARIIEGNIPATSIRIAAVALSVPLAWLTYVFLEKPIRRVGWTRPKVAILVTLMAAVGGLGYASYRAGGLPDRAPIKDAQTALGYLSWPQEESYDPTCRKYFPKFEYCRLAIDAQPTVALIGDSHANQFFVGLAEQYRNRNENLVMLGGPACPPLLDITSRYRGKHDRCDNHSSDALKAIAISPGVRTVILAANWHLYITGSRFSAESKMLPPWEIRILGNPSEVDNVTVFQVQLRKTIQFLRDHSKEVILIMQIPELDYDVSRCVAQRPIKITRLEGRCEIAGAKAKSYLDEYEKYFDAALAGEAGVTVWNPTPYFCDTQRCISVLDGNPLYRDDSHLSKLGSQYFASKIFPSPQGPR